MNKQVAKDCPKMTSTPSSTSSPRTSVKEYSIRVPKNVNKKYHVMRFNSTLSVEFDKWSQVKMERENNMKEFKGFIDEEQPKFGAGSEFGREAKEEARRKKLGIMPKKYKPDDQPWILKSSGSTVKKFKGIREGGVSENAAYYVFTHAANNIIQAFPLNEWYKFQPIQRYKALSAEEAEQEFSKRNKHLNFFSLMLRKRLKGDDDSVLDGESEEKGKGKKGSKAKELKISEMDEWMESSEDDSDEEKDAGEKDEEEKPDKKKVKTDAKKKRKKKKRDTDVEAFEDSDDGDGEGRELDYITDSSESEPENTKLEGVSEEKALRKLLNSDEEEDSDSDKSEKEDKDDEKDKDEENEEKAKDKEAPSKSKQKKNKKDAKKEKDKKSDNSDFSSDSSTDEEVAKKKSVKKAKKGDKEKEKEKVDEKPKIEKELDSPNSSRSASPILEGSKRKDAPSTSGMPQITKKPKLEAVSNYIPGASESGITEDAVRKYLMRKPMTTTELLQKFKSKKTGLSSEQLVNIMTQILKKINPVKQMLKGKMYLSIKS